MDRLVLVDRFDRRDWDTGIGLLGSISLGSLDHQTSIFRRMGASVNTHLQWHFGFWILRLPTAKMHNLTIALGLVVCMSAGALTVIQDTVLTQKPDTHRLFRTARRAGRKTKQYLTDLWN